MKLSDLTRLIDDKFQANTIDSQDFGGIQTGKASQEVNKVLVALEITNNVVNQAIKENVDLIVVHHPFIYKPIQSFAQNNYRMVLLTKLLKHDIALYVSHSPIDKHVHGINNYISELIGLNGIIKLEQCEYGVKGTLEEGNNLADFAQLLKSKLKIDFVKIIGETKNIKKIAIIAGDGDKYAMNVLKKDDVDIFITGDIYYHTAIDIKEEKLCAIDVGHNIEKYVVDVFERLLSDIKGIQVIKSSYSESPFKIV